MAHEPKSLAQFLSPEQDDKSHETKWGGIVSELGADAFTTPNTSPTRTSSTTNPTAAVDQAHQQQMVFLAELPASKHLFFLDKIRSLEHFFQVHFDTATTNSPTAAYFAFNAATKRLRRVVAQDRETLASAVFVQDKPNHQEVQRIQMCRGKLVKHLEDKHYPKTTSVLHLGTGQMCSLAEMFIHPNREDLIKEIQDTTPINALDALDQSLMLDCLSINHAGSESTEATAADAAASSVTGKDRPCTVAAFVLIFDEQWCCCNRDSIVDGLLQPETGAMVLHQTNVSSQQLWIKPKVTFASSGGGGSGGGGGGGSGSGSSGAKNTFSSAPDPGDADDIATPDMILNGGHLEYLENVLNAARNTLQQRQ